MDLHALGITVVGSSKPKLFARGVIEPGRLSDCIHILELRKAPLTYKDNDLTRR